MALAYTAPTWTDGSGEGISASNLQAISNCIEGLVQGSDKAVHAVSIEGSVITLTYADGTQENFNAVDLKGIVDVTEVVSDLDHDFTMTFTDGTVFTFTIKDGRDGEAVNLGDLEDVNISNPSADQVLKYDGDEWINGTAPASGHTMLPTPSSSVTEDDIVDAIKDGLLEGGTNDDVPSLNTIGTWSNCDAIVLLGEASQGDTGIGTWTDTWKTDNVRTGWLWSPKLYQILEKSNLPVHDIEIIPVFDVGQSETVSLYAFRIDDDVTNNGVNGGAIAFKFNGAIQSVTVKVGVKLVHQRTNVEYVTALS